MQLAAFEVFVREQQGRAESSKSNADQLHEAANLCKTLCSTQQEASDDLADQMRQLQASGDTRENQMIEVTESSAKLAADASALSLHLDHLEVQLATSTQRSEQLIRDLSLQTSETSTLVTKVTILETEKTRLIEEKSTIVGEIERMTGALEDPTVLTGDVAADGIPEAASEGDTPSDTVGALPGGEATGDSGMSSGGVSAAGDGATGDSGMSSGGVSAAGDGATVLAATLAPLKTLKLRIILLIEEKAKLEEENSKLEEALTKVRGHALTQVHALLVYCLSTACCSAQCLTPVCSGNGDATRVV